MAINKMEMIMMGLVVNGGAARSMAIEAIRAARAGEFAKADQLIRQCDTTLLKAHEMQTDLISREAAGEHMEVQLLMVHAQDQLMNAMTVRDLAGEMIEMIKMQK